MILLLYEPYSLNRQQETGFGRFLLHCPVDAKKSVDSRHSELPVISDTIVSLGDEAALKLSVPGIGCGVLAARHKILGVRSVPFAAPGVVNLSVR